MKKFEKIHEEVEVQLKEVHGTIEYLENRKEFYLDKAVESKAKDVEAIKKLEKSIEQLKHLKTVEWNLRYVLQNLDAANEAIEKFYEA